MVGKCTGKVKWFNKEKGFGFLIRDGVEEDNEVGKGVFVHLDSVIDIEGLHDKTLLKGQLVNFFVVKTDKGLKAIDVSFA